MKYTHFFPLILIMSIVACQPNNSNNSTSTTSNTEAPSKTQGLKAPSYEESASNPNSLTTDTKIGNKIVVVLGRKIGAIKYLNGDGQVNGGITSYFFYTDKEIKITTTASAHGEGVYAIYEQTIPVAATQSKQLEVEIRPFEDPEMFSDPTTYYVVSIGFKAGNGYYLEVGSTKEYSCSDNINVSEDVSKGTSRIIPFATQRQAEAFAAEIKSIINQ